MSKELIQKNIRLSHEFDQYVARHPNAYRRIPKGAHIVITSVDDKKLSEANYAIAQSRRGRKLIEAHKTRKGWQIKAFVNVKSQEPGKRSPRRPGLGKK
jgi:hypothetical protein